MDRTGIIRMLVLDVVSDDFENFEMMMKEMADIELSCTLKISPAEVEEAIDFLINRGWIKAYEFVDHQRTAVEISGVPRSEQIGECYYYQTRVGKEVNGIDANRPLHDDDFRLKSDWTFPA